MNFPRLSPTLLSPARIIQAQRTCSRYCAIADTSFSSIALTSGDGSAVGVWDTNTGEPIRFLAGHARNIKGCSISGDGQIGATAGGNGAVCIWNTSTGLQIWKLQMEGCRTTEGCSLTPDGFNICAIFSNTKRRKQGKDCWIVFGNVKNKTVVRSWHFAPANIVQCAISEDATIIAVTMWTKDVLSEVRVIEISTRRSLKRWKCSLDYKPGIALDSAGRKVLIADGVQLRICDVLGDVAPRVLSSAYPYVDCVLTADGCRAIATDHHANFHVWDLQTGDICAVLEQHPMRTRACSISMNGRKAITTSEDTQIRVWNLDEIERTTVSPAGNVASHIFSPFLPAPTSSSEYSGLFFSMFREHSQMYCSDVQTDSRASNKTVLSLEAARLSNTSIKNSGTNSKSREMAEDKILKSEIPAFVSKLPCNMSHSSSTTMRSKTHFPGPSEVHSSDGASLGSEDRSQVGHLQAPSWIASRPGRSRISDRITQRNGALAFDEAAIASPSNSKSLRDGNGSAISIKYAKQESGSPTRDFHVSCTDPTVSAGLDKLADNFRDMEEVKQSPLDTQGLMQGHTFPCEQFFDKLYSSPKEAFRGSS
jgi:WD40 repeat protein